MRSAHRVHSYGRTFDQARVAIADASALWPEVPEPDIATTPPTSRPRSKPWVHQLLHPG